MEYLAHILVLSGIFSLLAMSLDLSVGYTGIPAFGHAGFFLVGAYSSALLSVQLGVSPWFGILVFAPFLCSVLALVSYPALRLSEDNAALATLGIGIIALEVSNNWSSLTFGPMGVTGIPFLYLPFGLSGNEWSSAAVLWCLVSAIYIILRKLVRSPFGLVLRAINEDSLAALSLGRNVNLRRLQAFMVSGAIGGLAGGLYAHYSQYIAPTAFEVDVSISILLMVILGGAQTLLGPILGAILIISLPEVLRFLNVSATQIALYRDIVFGATLVCVVLFRPAGLLMRGRET